MLWVSCLLSNILSEACMSLLVNQYMNTCLRWFANNQGADQPAHPHSLISAFVIRLLKSIVSRLSTSEISHFLLVSVAEQVGLNLTLSKTPKTGFLATRPISVHVPFQTRVLMLSLIQPRRPRMLLSVDYCFYLFSVCYHDEYVCTGEGQFCDYTGQCTCEEGYIQEAGTKNCILGNITFTHIKIHREY